jgi:lipopolysaccharide transport system permease protein
MDGASVELRSVELRRPNYLLQMWRLRHFLFSLIGSDLRARYKRSILGIGWSLVRPLAMTCVFCLVFCPLFNLTIAEYAPFLLCGFTVWQMIMESMTGGCVCFNASAPYIRQQPLPLGIFPLRVVFGAGIHAGIAFLLVLVLVCFTRAWPGTEALASLLLSLVLLMIFCWSLAFTLGMVHSHFPDTQHLMEILFQVLFYLTPIMYFPEMIRTRPGFFGIFVDLNPLTYVLESIRLPALNGAVPSLHTYAIIVGFVAVMMTLTLFLRRRMERHLVFWL